MQSNLRRFYDIVKCTAARITVKQLNKKPKLAHAAGTLIVRSKSNKNVSLVLQEDALKLIMVLSHYF